MTLEELDVLIEECLASGLLMTEAELDQALGELLDADLLELDAGGGDGPRFTLTTKGWSEYRTLSDHDPKGAAEATPTRALPRLGRASRAAAAD